MTREEALREANNIVGNCWRETKNMTSPLLVDRFATAILDAEKRGREKERARCISIADDLFNNYSKPNNFDSDGKIRTNYVYVEDIAEAIRKGE